MSDSANSQYDNPPFGMGDVSSTGLDGSDGGSSTYAQYSNAGDLFSNVGESDLTSTGLNGSEPQSPPRDGSSATVTNGGYSGIPDGTRTGSTSTSKDSLAGLFDLGNVTETGIGSGDVSSSHTSAADQASRWKQANGNG